MRLSHSPLVGLTPSQLEGIARLLPAMLPAASAKPGEKPARRRRAGRKVKNAKMLAAISTDVESRRKRHGAWGLQGELHPATAATEPPNGLEDTWRTARMVPIHA